MQEQSHADAEQTLSAVDQEHNWQAKEFRKLMDELKTVRAEVTALRSRLDAPDRPGPPDG